MDDKVIDALAEELEKKLLSVIRDEWGEFVPSYVFKVIIKQTIKKVAEAYEYGMEYKGKRSQVIKYVEKELLNG